MATTTPSLGKVMKALKKPGQTLADFKAEWDELTEKDKLDLTLWLEAESHQ